MYKLIYDRASGSKRVAEIFTWVLLCILIPSTALGYFAEGSIPGQPLFPMKLGIEKAALLLQSFSPQSQAQYQIGLVNKRFDEIQTLLTKNTNSGEDLSNFGPQLQDATKYVISLPDSPEKAQMKETLLANIQTYQQQLREQQQVIENEQQIQKIQDSENNHYTKVTNSEQSAPSSSPNENANDTTTSNNGQNSENQNPDVSQALDDIQNQLDNSANDLSQDTSNTDTNITPTPTRQEATQTPIPTHTQTSNPNLTPTPTTRPTPTPTTRPTPTPTHVPYIYHPPTPTPTKRPTPTPTRIPTPAPAQDASLCNSVQWDGHCVDSTSKCSTYIITRVNYPLSCSYYYPYCCAN